MPKKSTQSKPSRAEQASGEGLPSTDLFSFEELMHLDHAMYYHNLKRLDFFHRLCLKDTKTRSGKTPTKEQIELARKDSQDCEKLLMKIRELRKENAALRRDSSGPSL